MVQSKEERRKRIIVQSTAGALASATMHLLHPFDVIKVRFQSHDSGVRERNVIPKYMSLKDSFKTIYREEGIRGFYKGMVVTLLASNIAYGLSFACYEGMKQKLRPHFENEIALDATALLFSSAMATFIMQPLFVIKTRRLLDLQQGFGGKRVWELSKELSSQHGIRGYFRGYSLSILLALNGVSQMSTYKFLKYKLDKIYGENNAPNHLIALGGAVSRIMTSVVLHPITTVRTRYQQTQFVQAALHEQKYTSIPDIFKKTYSQEGYRGFYKGLIPMTLRTLPSHSLFFLVYENTKNYMTKRMNIQNIK